MEGGREGGEVYFSSFHFIGGVDNDVAVLLPDHLPEVKDSPGQAALQ